MIKDRKKDRHVARRRTTPLRRECHTCSTPFETMDGRRRRCDDCSGDDAAWARKHRAENGKQPATLTELTCSKCKVTKSVTEFFCNRSTATGYHSSCKGCFNPDPDTRYRAKIYTGYRLRMDDIHTILVRQNYGCAVCTYPIDISTWRIDHDHSCDHEDKGVHSCKSCVRGLLCSGCNTFVGYLETRIDLLDKALEYASVLRIPVLP